MPRTKKEKKNTKSWAHPAAQDVNSSDDRFDETTGHVRNQDEISKLRKRKGLCPKCGLVRTHKRGVFGVGMSKDTRVGQVYKGVCLQCNTLYQAKMMLGEPVDSNFDRGSVLETHIRPAAGQMMMSHNTTAAAAQHDNVAANNSSILSPIRQQSVESSRGASSSNQSGNSDTGGNNAPLSSGPPPPHPQAYQRGDANMHPLASSASAVPTEISQEDGPCRKMSEISIPPEFQDLNNNDRLSSNASTTYREGSIPLVDIVEEEKSGDGGGIHQEGHYASHANVTVGSSASSSADHQSHGAPTSYVETITSSPHPSNARPGVVHFDNSTAEGRGHRPLDRLQQRILEKNRAHGEASKKPPAAGATASPSSSSSSAKTSSTHRRAQSENTTSPSSTPTSSHTRSKTEHAPSSLHVPLSPGASCVSASDQLEAQRQRKILDADIIQSKSSESEKSRQGSADEEFNRRLLQKAASSKKTVTTAGGGGDEESKPGVSHHASGKGDTLFDRKVSSSDEDSKPGVTHASSKADSLYNQKMAARRGNRTGEDDSKPGITPQSGKGSTIYEQKMGTGTGTAHDVRGEEEDVAMEEYRLDDVHAQEMIETYQSCNDLFDFLKEKSPLPPSSVIQTLIRMRDLLPPPSETLSSTTTSFSKDWPTHIFDAMTAHPSDQDVQAEGFRTVWSIISTNNHLASDLISYAEKKDIMHAMEAHKKSSLVQGCGAGLIACIASTEKYARQLLGANDGRFIQRLMVALKFRQIGDEGDHFSHGAVQECAMKALYHLSSASLASSRKMVFFGKKMGSCAGVASAENNPSIHALDAVLHSMGLHPKNISVQVYGNRLLCNIFNFDEIGDEERCEKWISKYLLYTNAAQTYHLKSQPYCESTICLLSMISSESCTWCDGDVFPKVVTKLMSSSDSPLVAQYGCRCLHNICTPSSGSASDSQAAFASLGGIGIIISSMEEFNEHQSIQSEACLALSALCINSPSNKTIVMEQGGIDSIFAAYQSYSSSKQYDSVGLMTKIRACTALISLAADPDCISEMKSIGIVEKLDCLRLEDEKMPVQLSRLIQRLHTLTSEQENDDWLVEFREGASEDETAVCILANLKMIVQKDDDHRIDTLSLTSNILWAMRKFSMSKPVQENASKLLACLYSSYQSQVGEEIYTEVLETVEASLREHQSDQDVVAAACSVIRNICITSLKAGSETSQILSDILYSSILEVANAMDLCIENENTVEQASGALFALCNTKPSLVVSLGTINPGTSNSIRVLTDAMKKFPTSNELHKNAISVLSTFFTYSDNIIRDERSLECVKNVATVLANFIKQAEDEEETTYVALQILKLLSDERGYESKMALSGNVEIIAAIVNCMFSYPNSLLIQGAACDILRSLSVNNHKRAQVCQQGGTTRIISALGRMNTDSTFVCKAFMALENLISGADIDVLTANDTPQVLFNAIDAFPESVYVHIKGAAVVWHLSSRDNSFKDAFVRNGAARLISEAMTRFLPSQDLQQKGFLTIWSLATRKALKDEIGHYATLPIINGLAAHCSPDDLSSSPGGDRQQFCQEGLGALKCLSTSTPNKRVLVEHGAIELITRILWLYSEDDSLCIAALSALSNICVDVDSNQVLRISSDVLDAVVYVMRTHQNVKEVQSIVIVLLRNFTFSPSNCLLLQENPFVSSLVNNAMVRFNTSFQGRAEDVLRVLPSLVQ